MMRCLKKKLDPVMEITNLGAYANKIKDERNEICNDSITMRSVYNKEGEFT